MKKQVTKLYLNDLSEQNIYKFFGLRKVSSLPALTEWLSNLPILNDVEKTITTHYQQRLLENISAWNEQELSLGFIGPILNVVVFKVPYRLNLFAQRSISKVIGAYELIGKPDGMLASGFQEPEIPYFSFHEYKKELKSSGDPAGQNLAAMLIGQAYNEDKLPIYGCYVVGRNWFFMVLQGKEYAISKAFSADDQDIFEIVKILKSLRSILFQRLGIAIPA